MADLDSNWQLGEYRGQVMLLGVEYNATLVAGDFARISGRNSDGALIVIKHNGKNKADFVIPAGSDGVAGDFREVLQVGLIKVKFGGITNVGNVVAIQNNEVQPVTSGLQNIGTSYTDTTADGDFGIIYFDGQGKAQ